MAKKLENLTRPEFKSKVIEYFSSVDAINKQRKLEHGVSVPLSIPGFARHLGWPISRILEYPEDGKFYEIIEYAKIQIENFLIQAAFDKSADKALIKMMLETYHGYGASKAKASDGAKKKLRRISDILNDIENE